MSWFPNFLSPWPAIIAGAIAVPALLVLYFLKLRRRELVVSSTLLWKKAIQDLQVNAPFQKLRRNLLLLLQLLLLLMLCLALSRPVSNYTPGAGKTSIILIDRSASMSAMEGQRTRLEEAKRKAKDLVDSMGRNASACVVAFDDKPEVLQGFTTDTSLLRSKIDSILPTDRKTRLKLAYQVAQAQFAIIPEQLRPGAGGQLPDVWLFSDGRALDANEASLRANLNYTKIGSDETGNIGVVALSAKRNYERPTEVQVFARCANFGPQPTKAQVQLSVEVLDSAGNSTGNNVRSVAEVSLPPERWSDPHWVKDHPGAKDDNFVAKDSVEFTLELTSAAVITVEQMNKEGDALPADDAAHVVVPPPKALAVLLVTDGNYYLEKVLASLKLQNPTTMLPQSYENKVPTDYDVIIFDRYYPKQLPRSGNFIYFGCAPPKDVKLHAAEENGHPATIDVPADEYMVLDWKRDHPILRNRTTLGKIYSTTQVRLEVPPDAEVLMEGTKGPLVVLYHEPTSTHLVFAFDLMQSNWPLQVSFPLVMHNALQFLALGENLDVRQSVEPGATPRIPRTALQKADPNLTSVRLNGPGGSRELPIPAAGDFVLPSLDKVGVYSTSPPIPQFERIAVNLLDDNESNLVPVDKPPGGMGGATVMQSKKSRLELWWWIIACAALPLLMIEWWVYTRRVHL